MTQPFVFSPILLHRNFDGESKTGKLYLGFWNPILMMEGIINVPLRVYSLKMLQQPKRKNTAYVNFIDDAAY